MRIAVGGLWHETNTFSPFITSLGDFESYQYAKDEQVISLYSRTGTEIGGMIDEAPRLGVELVPLVFAAAVPAGKVTALAFRHLVDQMLDRLVSVRDLNGVVLALHGAMVAENENSPEASLLTQIRKSLGPLPIVLTLDLHANVDERLCSLANVLVAYDTFPHVDMADRGREALQLAVRILNEDVEPESSLVRVPLITVPQCQDTNQSPMKGIVDSLHSVEAEPGVWTGSVLPGYPYSDLGRLGFSVYVAGAGSRDLARALADQIWLQRRDFDPLLTDPEEAVATVDQVEGSVALVDASDNVGGGSPGNGTVLLDLLERRGRADGIVVIWDPECITRIYGDNPDGGGVTVQPTDRDLGPSVYLRGSVFRHGHVRYKRTGPYMRGQIVDMGRVAIASSATGQVVITERRVMPFDADHVTCLGLDPTKFKVIVVKSASAWKVAFPHVAKAIYVNTPGYCPSDLDRLTYTSRPKPAYPLEPAMIWTASSNAS